ncbi:MAG: DegV family EDD domain-containing protein [Candidatus Heimdallarchaeota archaeon]|nr:DegV family EDD domain-containing protein [Candidatus Heimdallarchaeota archaeon]
MKIKITTDVTTCIPKEIADKNDIGFVEFYISINEKPTKELSEINREKFLNEVKFMIPYPTSSFPSPQDYLDAFQKAEDDGYDEILHIGLGLNISGALNSANAAAKRIKKTKVTVYDSGIMGPSQGTMVLMALKLLKKGKSVEEVIEYLESVKLNIYGAGLSESFDVLFKTGRVKKGAGITVMSSLMRLKPLFELNFEKGVTGIGGGMGFNGARKKIISNIIEKTDDKITYDLYMTDAGAPKLLKQLEEEIVKVRNIKNIYYWPMVSMMINTCGKGSVIGTLSPTLDEV